MGFVTIPHYGFFDALEEAKVPTRVKDLIDNFASKIDGVEDGLITIGEFIWEKAFEAGRQDATPDFSFGMYDLDEDQIRGDR